MMAEQPKGIPEGIYFNLSNEDYHADPALSHSGMTKVLISWPDYWVSSCHNPKRAPFKQTDAMRFGELSSMLLTQPKLFYKKYNTFNKEKPNLKGLYLSSIEWADVKESVDAILKVKAGKDHFSHGHAEVSIFWRDPGTGIMLRARVDYLHIFGCIDYKRIADLNNYSVGYYVKKYGLDIQAFHYLEAVKAARKMLKAMSDYDLMMLSMRELVDEHWLTDFRDDTDLLFRFVFQRSKSPYIWEFRELTDDVFIEGGHAVFEAIKKYNYGLKTFGLGLPPMGEEKIKDITRFHVPRRDYDYEQ